MVPIIYWTLHWIRVLAILSSWAILAVTMISGSTNYTPFWTVVWIYFIACVGFLWHWHPTVEAVRLEKKRNR